MRIKNRLGAVALTVALAIPTAAVAGCEDKPASVGQDQAAEDNGVDDDGGAEQDPCELDDQKEGDRDCGYYSSPGIWAWYWWVVLGRTSTPPAGWHRPYSYPKTKPGSTGTKTGTKAGTSTGSTGSKTSTGTKTGSTGTRSGTTSGSRTSSGGGRR